MAATGFTPVQIYSSSTGGLAPTAGNLTNSTLGSELAINITDGYLYYKDNANVVQKIGYKLVPTANGGTGLTSFTANGIVYALSTSALATGSAITFDGTNFATTGSATAKSFIPSNSAIPTNGLYLPATNNVGLATNSTLAVHINSSQQVGVGTSSQTQTFQVYSGTSEYAIAWQKASSKLWALASYNGGAYLTNTTDSRKGIQFLDAGETLIFGGGSERMRFFTTGGASFGDTTDPGAGNLRLGTGNLVIGTSGKGIDFSATPGTGTSELFADYEEGTFTPTWTGLTTVGTVVYNTGYYVKIGRVVYYTVQLQYSTSIATTQTTTYHTLPFNVAQSGSCFASNVSSAAAINGIGLIYNGSSVSYVPTVSATGSLIAFSGTYYST